MASPTGLRGLATFTAAGRGGVAQDKVEALRLHRQLEAMGGAGIMDQVQREIAARLREDPDLQAELDRRLEDFRKKKPKSARKCAAASKKKVTNNPNAIFVDGRVILGVGKGGDHVAIAPSTGRVVEDLGDAGDC